MYRPVLVACLTLLASSVHAVPISVDADGDSFEVYHFRDLRGVNSVGFTPTDRLTFGLVNVTPNGHEGTTVTARQGEVTTELGFFPSRIQPNEFAGSVPYDPALTGSWEFTLRNGADSLVVTSPAPGNTPNTGLATDVRLAAGANTLTPTFSWINAGDADTIKLSVYDLERRISEFDFAERIFVRTVRDGDRNRLTLPAGLLEDDHLYSVSVTADFIYTDGVNPSGSSRAGAARSRSRSFFDFSTGDLPDVPDLFLPSVDTSGDVPIFNFDNAVVAGRVEFYDPLDAVGYEYAVGEGDPEFASVLLPDLGDNVFSLYLFDGGDFVFDSLLRSGIEHFFSGGGVRQFQIRGIETSERLDPEDAAAFVTGLSFAGDGRFTGTMVPLVEAIEVAEPPVVALALMSMMGLLGTPRLRRTRARP